MRADQVQTKGSCGHIYTGDKVLQSQGITKIVIHTLDRESIFSAYHHTLEKNTYACRIKISVKFQLKVLK